MSKAAFSIALPIAAALILSLLAGTLMTCAAWQHNPQGEFHDDTGIHYGELLMIFGGWFAAVMGITSPFLIGWIIVKSRSSHRMPR